MPRTENFRSQHGSNEIFTDPVIFLRNTHAQKAQRAGLIQQGRHQAFFLVVDTHEVIVYVLLQEIPGTFPRS